MRFARRLRATQVLVLAGICLSYASYGVAKLGGPGELYPFFHWRLYSAPAQPDSTLVTYRLYTRAAPGASWERHPVAPTATFDRKEYVYFWDPLVAEAASDPAAEAAAREQMEAFAHEIAPGAYRYRVVAEAFRPMALLDGALTDDTTTVFHISGGAAGPGPLE